MDPKKSVSKAVSKIDSLVKSINNFKMVIYAAGFLIAVFLVVILYIVILEPIFSNYTVFLGISKEDLNDGKYADVDLEELNSNLFDTSCYESASGSWFASSWLELKDKLTPGINSSCELIELIKFKVIKNQKQYSEYGLEISPGLVTSAIINTFGGQAIDDLSVDSSEPINMLNAVVDSKILTEDDIDTILDAMIFKNKFWYYVCNTTTCQVYDSETGEEKSANGKQCEKRLYYDVYWSQEKFDIFLRYGIEVANTYQAAYSHNEAIKYTCDGCYVEFGGSKSDLVSIILDKYLAKADTKSDAEDNIKIKISENEYNIFSNENNSVNQSVPAKLKQDYSVDTNKEYTYKDGFIYNKFPIYKSANYIRQEKYIPKDIELDVDQIRYYSEDVNEMFDLTSLDSGSRNHQNISLKSTTKPEVCPSSEGCKCSNGNLTPTPGIPVMTGDYANSPVCNYLPINTASETMIRLRSCDGVPTDLDKAMPGGYTYDDDLGVYVANIPISLKRYIIGVGMAEIGPKAPLEALKMQMLASQTYLMNSLERGGIKTNSNGELLVKVCSQQFQAYYDKKVVDYYDNDTIDKKQDYDAAYEAIKNQLVFSSQTGKTIFAEFGAVWSKARSAQANSGMTYVEMLASEEVKNYSKAPKNVKNWLYSVLKTCELSEVSNTPGTFVPDPGTTTLFKPNSTYPYKSQTLGIFGYITYYQPDPNKRDINYDGRWESANIVRVKRDCGNGLSISWKVHKLAKTAFEKAADGICQLTTTGIDGIIIDPSDIDLGGVFYPRKMTDALSSPNLSNHSFGTAIDINSNYNIEINGETYRDIYDRKIEVYEKVIAALGSESDPRNINYILWKKVFQNLGFKWGGNWGRFGDDNKYDGMHFEIDWRQTK